MDLPLLSCMAQDCMGVKEDPVLPAGGMNWETAWIRSSRAPAWTVLLYALHEGGTAVPKDAALVRKEGAACE
jgi:hypothetical protein